ncbi:hypothetical protein FISHEDRAFT_50093, partial [Fistulina hepatica ATCC 64428]
MKPLLLVVWTWLVFVVSADRNVTVDDDARTIGYIGNWSTSAKSSLDYGGTHHHTKNKSAAAVFTFNGTAVYFMSPLWPYAVTTTLTLDDEDSVLVDLRDYSSEDVGYGSETVASAIVWGKTGLNDNNNHTFVISAGEGTYAIVDA